MPTLRERPDTTRGTNDSNNHALAFHLMKDRHLKPFPVGRKQFRFLIVAINYFTKWVEVELAVTITDAKSPTLYGRT